MERVLSSAELLDLVFTFTDRATDARCARVCKIWSDAAIKQLWRSVKNLQRIFSILAPIKQVNKSGTYKYTRVPTREDWSRYYKYASNVKYLSVLDDTWIMAQVHQEVSRGRTQLYLFPNLVKLSIVVNSFFVENAALYLHEGLRSIVIYVTEETVEHLGSFLETVADRTGNIEEFDLYGEIHIRPYERQLLRVFHRQRAIRHIILPIYFNSSSMVTSLAQLRNLRVIELRYSDGGETSEQNRRDVLDFNPNLSVDAFPKLTDLDLAVGVLDMKRFLLLKYMPENISTLYFVTLDFHTADTLRDCFEIIGSRCKSLQHFTLAMAKEATVTSYRTTYAITLDILAPILNLRGMAHFTISHPKPLALTARDIKKIARSWPSIETLSLNPEPLVLDEPQFGLPVLQNFSQYCPELRRLELYLDTTSNFSDSNISFTRSKRLKALEHISFGASPINDPETVAIYLSEILPIPCKLQTSIGWAGDREDLVEEEYIIRRDADMELWDYVVKLLPVLTKAYERNMSEVERLAKENEILRAMLSSIQTTNH